MYIISKSAKDDERVGNIVKVVRELYPDIGLNFLTSESAAMINYFGVKDISDHLDYTDTEIVGKWKLLSQDQRIHVLTSLTNKGDFDEFQCRLFDRMMDNAPERIKKIYEEDGGTYIRTREEIAKALCGFCYDLDPYGYGDNLQLGDDGFELGLAIISSLDSATIARDNVAEEELNPEPPFAAGKYAGLLADLNRVVADLEYSEPFQEHTQEDIAKHLDSFYYGRKNATPAIEWINDLTSVRNACDDVQKCIDHAIDMDGFHPFMYEDLLSDLNQLIERLSFWFVK